MVRRGKQDASFGGGYTVDTAARISYARSYQKFSTYAFNNPLSVRELPSDSVAVVEAVGTPVDFLSRLVE
jgi:hypothetical protein